MRMINYHPGLVILLTAFVLSCGMQVSLAQSNNVLKEGSIKLISQLVNEPQAGELLYSDNLDSRKVSNFPASSGANVTRYFKNGKYHMNVISEGYSTWSFAGKNFSDFILEVNATQEKGPVDNDYGVITDGRMQETTHCS